MAKIRKNPSRQNEPGYRNARVVRREEDQGFQTWRTQDHAAKLESRLDRPDKRARNKKDMDLLGRFGKDHRGEVGYRFLRNEKLTVENEGELTRTSGWFRKKKEVLKHNDSGEAYVARLEEKKGERAYDFDEKGKLNAISVDSSRFEEKWVLDKNGEWLRTKYFTNRFRDVGFGPALSEDWSKPYERAGKTYRTLTRQQGSRKKVYEAEKNEGESVKEWGKLKLIEREAGGFSKRTTESEDGKTSHTDIKHRGKFAKSYRSLLGPNGEVIGKDITSIRRLWNKRSDGIDDKTGWMTGAKHTFGKLYKSETTFTATKEKYTIRKLLGVKLPWGRGLKPISSAQRKANELRAEELARHKLAWEEVKAAPQSPRPATAKQLGAANTAALGTAALEEDENVAFLKSLGRSDTAESASPSANTGSHSKTDTARGDIKSTPVKEAAKAAPAGLRKPVSAAAGKDHPSVDMAALLSGFKPIVISETSIKDTPSRQNSAKSSNGSSVTLDVAQKDAAQKRGYEEKGRERSPVGALDF